MKSSVFILFGILSFSTLFAGNKSEPLKNLYSVITENITYPESSIENKEEGTVYLSFEVNENNEVTNVQVEAGVSDSLNAEAIRVCNSIPAQVIKNMNYKAGQTYVLPIKFRLL